MNSLKTKDQRLKIKEQRTKIKENILNPESDQKDFSLPVLRPDKIGTSEDGSSFQPKADPPQAEVFSLDNRYAITLYPVTYISSDIDTTTTWYSNHNYIIEDDITVFGDLYIACGPHEILRKTNHLTGDILNE